MKLWQRAAMAAIGFLALGGVAPCSAGPDVLGSAVEVSWVIVRGGEVADCAAVGATIVHITQTDLDSFTVDEHDSDCGLAPTIVPAPEERTESVKIKGELRSAGGRVLATSQEITLDLTSETRAGLYFDMGGAVPAGRDAGVPLPDAGTVPCAYGPTDPTNRATARATIDGRIIDFSGLCIRGEVDQAIAFDVIHYPSFTAVRQASLQSYSEMFIELNPSRKTATPTCDHLEIQGGMTGNGLVRFETTDLLDGAGKPTQIESRLGGTFTVGGYSDAVGGRIAGSFDCPVGSPGGPTRGSISGSFDVKLE